MHIHEGSELDDQPGCGGWVVDLYGRIYWPWPDSTGRTPIGTQSEAELIAAAIPGAKAVRIDLVLRAAQS